MDRNRPPGGYIKGNVRIDAATLEVHASNEASKVFARRRGRRVALERSDTEDDGDGRGGNVARPSHQALALLLVLEMAYAVADVFAVDAQPSRPVYAGDGYLLAVRIRPDKSCSDLSEILGLRPPAVRLKELIDAEGLKEAVSWSLSDSGALGSARMTRSGDSTASPRRTGERHFGSRAPPRSKSAVLRSSHLPA